MNSTAVGLLSVSIIFPLLSLLAVLLRFWARRLRSSPKADDWVIVCAQVFCFGLGINTIVGVAKGVIGKPQQALGPQKAVVLLKIVYGDSFLCFTALAIVKVSILLFYKRVFATKGFFLAANIMICVTLAWFTGSIFALLFSYYPISTHWSLRPDPAAKKIDFQAFLVTHASLDLVLDIAILCLPIPAITTLQMEIRRKIALIAIFWLGAFCAVAEAVRIYYFHRFLYEDISKHADAFGPVVANVLIWSRVEPCMSVIAACLPTLRPVISSRTAESIVASVRSAISLRSLGSGGSRGTNNSAKRADKSDLEDSRRDWVRLNNNSGSARAEMDPSVASAVLYTLAHD
ncbi:hypothetical protein P171DRAFT_524784 [Karstenula rhodostoma CBS 690.94]|uniref:Rhodopsin domain-containing protein n=1 Tax=Karstenula rhodostoma CBS 690.94 TaxID=1392251 RepID=A0A9P4U7D0_9PLEO|nr:hypothetical protein P171DRAFT_524784 [Karstenula rhodostoma CBS 690.94]